MKKKRVRYLAAAATATGLAPLATGMAFPAAAQAATSCTGHTEFYLPKVAGMVKGHGWYTNESGGKICIGTVVVSVYTSTTGYDWPEAQVAWSYFAKVISKSAKVYGTAGTWQHADFGYHRSGSPSVYVDAWSGYYYSTTNTYKSIS